MTKRHMPNSHLANRHFQKKGDTWIIGIPLEEKLDGIVNSYLLFNNRSDIVEWTGYQSINSYKPLSFMSRKRKGLVYNMFDTLSKACLYDNDFVLDTFITIYDSVSTIYTKHFKRSRILNRFKQNNVQDFISYYFGLKRFDQTNKWIVKAADSIREEMSSEYMPLLVLMILGIIPPFKSQLGCGMDKNINIEEESERACKFIKEYSDSFQRPINNELFDLTLRKFHYINRLVIIEEFQKSLNRFLVIISKHISNNNYEELTDIFKCIQTIRADGIEILCNNNERFFISSESYPKILNLRIKDECQIYKLGETTYIMIDKINLFITANKENRSVTKQ